MNRILLAVALAVAPGFASAAAPSPVVLARGGQAAVAIVVGENALPRTKQAAADLAAYLGKITGGRFEVKTGDGTSGLAVGLPGHFPDLPTRDRWAKPAIAAREDYLLHTHPQGAYLLGATEQAVEHAVWDFLYRLGYRQFFPGEHWEVVPTQPSQASFFGPFA